MYQDQVNRQTEEDCLAWLDSLDHQSRDLGDLSQPTDVLWKIDQSLRKLSSQPPAGSASSLLAHLEAQFLLNCGFVLVEKAVVDEDLWEELVLIMRQIYMAAWLGKVEPELSDCGAGRKVVAGLMFLSLTGPGTNWVENIPRPTTSPGQTIFQALFTSEDQRRSSHSSWLWSQEKIITQKLTDPPSREAVLLCVPGYLGLHLADLHKFIWLLQQFPGGEPDQQLSPPFSLPWADYTNDRENLAAQDFTNFIEEVLQQQLEDEDDEDDEEEGLFLLPPTLTEVKLTEDQKLWWRVACRALTEAELDEEEREILRSRRTPQNSRANLSLTPLVRRLMEKQSVEWQGEGLATEDGRTYYGSVTLDGELTVSVGDTVLVKPTMRVARVSNLFTESEGEENMAHLVWFARGVDTVLRETADRSEVFQLTECEDQPLASVWGKCSLQMRPQADQSVWRQLGGYNDARSVGQSEGQNLWCQLHYSHSLKEPKPKKPNKSKSTGMKSRRSEGRFESLKSWPECPDEEEEKKMSYCGCCAAKKEEKERFSPGELVEFGGDLGILWDRAPLRQGDSVYLDPGSVKFKKSSVGNKMSSDLGDYFSKENEKKQNEPFQVGSITEIIKSGPGQEIKLKVRMFCRPEDSHEGSGATYRSLYNELYFTQLEATVPVSKVRGRCYVKWMEEEFRDKDEEYKAVKAWTEEGPDRFFFRQSYRPAAQMFEELPDLARSMTDSRFPRYPPMKTSERLRGLDIFAGAGGLSLGLHQSGVSRTDWAIEADLSAAAAYQLNNPDCTVFSEDCNHILSLAMEEVKHTELGQKVPMKGEVDLLCGGPPCQGFSIMNSNKEGEKSQNNNNLVYSYLSFCDFYRPRFFILENVQEFAKGWILKKCLSGLVEMGYQCSFSVMQAGQFGVPQSRRRLIILAAAPGEKLPLYPEPQHVFFPSASPQPVRIDGVLYEANTGWKDSAPYRTVSLLDAIRDLPRIDNDHDQLEMNYDQEPVSHFQREMREDTDELTCHVPKKLSNLNVERFKRIPPSQDMNALPEDLRPRFLAKKPRKGAYGRPSWRGPSRTVTTNPNPGGRQGEVGHPTQSR